MTCAYRISFVYAAHVIFNKLARDLRSYSIKTAVVRSERADIARSNYNVVESVIRDFQSAEVAIGVAVQIVSDLTENRITFESLATGKPGAVQMDVSADLVCAHTASHRPPQRTQREVARRALSQRSGQLGEFHMAFVVARSGCNEIN